jgi:hypothetical protein
MPIEAWATAPRAKSIDGNGELVPVNLADMRALIDKHICGVRLVRNGTGWQREYFTYRFDTPRRPDPRTGGPRPPPDDSAPDANVLDQIYRFELAWRVPKVNA